MVALTQGRATREAIDGLFEVPVAASMLIYAGALVAVNAAGFATKGATATTLRPFGRAESTVDNSAGAAGAQTIQVRTGIFEWVNSASGDLITIADVGVDCFIVDDQTVAKTNGGATRSRAGRVVGFNGAGVLVRMGPNF